MVRYLVDIDAVGALTASLTATLSVDGGVPHHWDQRSVDDERHAPPDIANLKVKVSMTASPLHARDVMTTAVLTAPATLPVASLARLIADRGVSAVPVVDDKGQLLGIVTEADLLRRLAGAEDAPVGWLRGLFVNADEQATQYARTHGMAAQDIMTSAVVTVKPDATVEHCAHLMEERRIKRLPVIEDGRLVGVVSRADLLRAVLEPPARIAAAVQPRDARIRAALRAEMLDQPWVSVLHSFADVRDGVITLHGSVPSEAMRRGLHVLATRIEDVERIDDQLVIAPMLLPRALV